MISINMLDKIPILVAVLLIPHFLSLFKKTSRIKLMSELLTNNMWKVNIVLILVFSIVIYWLNNKANTQKLDKAHHEEIKKHKEAVKKGILALIISLFAHLRLTIAPFWFVFILAYYFEGWV